MSKPPKMDRFCATSSIGHTETDEGPKGVGHSLRHSMWICVFLRAAFFLRGFPVVFQRHQPWKKHMRKPKGIPTIFCWCPEKNTYPCDSCFERAWARESLPPAPKPSGFQSVRFGGTAGLKMLILARCHQIGDHTFTSSWLLKAKTKEHQTQYCFVCYKVPLQPVGIPTKLSKVQPQAIVPRGPRLKGLAFQLNMK